MPPPSSSRPMRRPSTGRSRPPTPSIRIAPTASSISPASSRRRPSSVHSISWWHMESSMPSSRSVATASSSGTRMLQRSHGPSGSSTPTIAAPCSAALSSTRHGPPSPPPARPSAGEHVWRQGAADFRQVTVTASDIVTADVLATAILSGGRATRDAVTDRWDVDVLTVDQEGALDVTPRLRRLISQHAA